MPDTSVVPLVRTLRTLHSYLRYSLRRQRLGDSERRQLARGQRWAADNAYRWSESYRDEGLSGYDGTNVKKGDLRRLLDDVLAQSFSFGDAIWIENIDRLSRLPPWESIQLFQQIINACVPIVVDELGDDDEPLILDRDRLIREDHLLDRVYGELKRAHRESKRKSSALARTCDNKREKARRGEVPFPGRRTKAWLKLLDKPSPDGLWYKEIKSKARAVHRAYQLAADNIGVNKIAEMFEGIEPRLDTRVWKKRKKDWHGSYILQLLKDDAVLGLFQPHHWVNKKRIKAGDPIKCYPEIVDPALVSRTRAALAGRATHGRGRKGEVFSNIVTGIPVCASCGGGITLYNPGARKGRPKLHCYNKHCANRARFLYEPFEEHLFALSAAKIADLLERVPVNTALEREVAELQLRLDRERRQQREAARLIGTLAGSAQAALMEEYVRLGAAIDAGDKELITKQHQLRAERVQPDRNFRTRFDRVMKRIWSTDPREQYRARAALNQEFKRVIKRLTLYQNNTIGIGVSFAYRFEAGDNEDDYIASGLFEFVLGEEGVRSFRFIAPDGRVYGIEGDWAAPVIEGIPRAAAALMWGTAVR
jgi:hypothetical protein